MRWGPRVYLIGAGVLVALAGCGRDYVPSSGRAPWRHHAEVACLKSGDVRLGVGIVQTDPIDGPGMCGADFPLKVAALGDSISLGFAEAPRPPGAIPNASPVARWPVAVPRNAPPPQPAPVYTPGNQPISLDPRGGALPPSDVPADAMRAPRAAAAQRMLPDDIPDDAILPPGRANGRSYPQTQPAYRAPPAPPQRDLPVFGRPRAPRPTGTVLPAAVKPTATLACPMVSALDRWIVGAVQPSALRWFGQPVVQIKQISAYSCRGMNGNPNARISEHAFGNALDIASFKLADGHVITVKNGWNGTPEEQGFLHDVQLAACDVFHTVLAPGSNKYHADHFHFDLMRRKSGRRYCKPKAISGEIAAARAAQKYAKRGDLSVTGSIGTKPGELIEAVPGQDGIFEEDDGDQLVTGSIPAARADGETAIPGQDGYFED